jgi:hypothetical protein
MAVPPPNPIAQGFRATVRRPALFLLEIGWRWLFWALAALIAFQTFLLILNQLQLSDLAARGWRTQDYRLLAAVGLNIVIKPAAVLLRLLFKIIALALALGLLWSVFAALARRITVRKLEYGREPLRFGGMLTVQGVRAMATVLAGLLLIASLVAAIYFATKGPHTDVVRFYLLVSPAAVLIVGIWLVVNWYVSQAAMFGRTGQGFRGALREARRNIRRHSADCAGIAFIFTLLRFVLLLIALAVVGLGSSMMARAPQAYYVLVLGVLVGYCLLADFLYIARTAAYLALAATPDPIAAEMGIVDPELPVENSSSR